MRITALVFVIPIVFFWPELARAQAAKPAYAAMGPLDQYLIPDERAEIALARSSAPASISDAADVMVLRREGYGTAVKGSNGFVCIVERSWAKPTDDPEFWNPKVRAPNCFNPAASRTFLPIYLKKTKLVLAGKSKAQILAATTSAFETRELPALAPGAMCYMMAKQQYLSDDDMSWHPHVMFFVSGNAVKSWGANLPDSPVIAGNDPEERVTVFMIFAGTWSDGTPGPSLK
ncbi:MAG: hypothetical protein JO051_03695 [Acidobacteriaceae bacterium]|nr:hypothetical protein [Acidobacteriaceae bacterium]